MDDKRRYLRWMERRWEIHNSISREEKRKAEILEVFEGLGELARRRVKVPKFPPWEPHW